MKHYNDDREKSMPTPTRNSSENRQKRLKYLIWNVFVFFIVILAANVFAVEKDYQVPWCEEFSAR